MPQNRVKHIWADPNREGKATGRQSKRYCAKCGNSVRKARILKSLNLCEFCIKELENKRDGKSSCRGCGKVAPAEVQEHNGYCTQCICAACGKPDPIQVRKIGLCTQCSTTIGDFCRKCGKEASAQVKKNKGLCDECKKGSVLEKPKRVARYERLSTRREMGVRQRGRGKKKGSSSL